MLKLRRLDQGDLVLKVVAYGLVGLFSVACLIPFWMVIAGSITEEQDLVFQGYQLIPPHLSGLAYQVLFQGSSVFDAYKVSIFVTFTGTFGALLVGAALAYAIANKRNRYRRVMAFYIYLTMLFTGGLIPFYVLVTKYLHLTDNLLALILPGLVSPYYIFLMVSYFRTLPEEISESARIDGANEFVLFTRIVLPLCTAILACVSLFYALDYWNNYLNALLFINDTAKYPLQLLLRRLIDDLQAQQTLFPAGVPISVNVPGFQVRMATTAVTIGPIVLLYPLVQRYFVKGITLGAVKE